MSDSTAPAESLLPYSYWTEEALRVLKTGRPALLQYGITADMLTDVGLSCGGRIDVFVEPLDW